MDPLEIVFFWWRWGFSRPVRFPQREGICNYWHTRKTLEVQDFKKQTNTKNYSSDSRLGKGLFGLSRPWILQPFFKLSSLYTLQQLQDLTTAPLCHAMDEPSAASKAFSVMQVHHEWSNTGDIPGGHWFPARGHCFPRRLEEFEGWNAHTFRASGYCARRCPAGRALVSCFAQEIQINGSKMKIPRFEMVPFLGRC